MLDEVDGLVFNHRNNPDLPAETTAELTENGIGVVDWETEFSWNHGEASDNRRGAAKRSLETMQKLNEYGGYGIMHTTEFEKVTIGRVDPPCIRFLKLENVDEEVKHYKAFQFDTFAKVDGVKDKFPAVHALIRNRTHLETLQNVKENEEAETTPRSITDAYVKLDLAGELEQSDYESEYGP